MSSILDEQIKQLKQTIAEMEAQRPVLGDAAVDAALVPFREKLAELEVMAETPKEAQSEIIARQRKLVTILHMDVVDSTAMTQHLDPEDTLEIMDNALMRLAGPITSHGGHVTRYMGDGFLAIFGDPVTKEDDPEQAIRSGLEILEKSRSLAQELRMEWDIENFQVRIGIDTGLAALGGQTEAEDTIMGRVVNLAVRIESAAPPGGLLISHNTYRHVRGVFNVEPLEPIAAKGFPETIPVYLVMEIKPRAFRVQTRGVEGVETHMVGRHNELRFLQNALMTAFEEGEGHVVTVSGEAGVGKSRLLYEFDNWLELLPSSQAVRFFQGRGRQEAQSSPYSLLRDLFAFRFQILDDDKAEQARRKIDIGFGEVFGIENDGIMRSHILGQLLGFDFSDSPHLKGVLYDAEQLRNRGVMYLIQYFQALSQEIPVVIFLEDIHWGDDSSLDVVSRIGEYTPQYPILIVCNARPNLFERRAYWGEGQTNHTRIELQPLSKRDSRQLVIEILKMADEIPIELRELIINGAEGNPFYVEELIKVLIEDGVIIPDEGWRIEPKGMIQVEVPATLAGVLQARLDSLPVHERTVLQQASVVGRLFWDRIVSYIQTEGGNGGNPKLISETLTSLRNRELVYRHEESAFADAEEYLFKHDILREVTYESVLKRLRKTYHGLVADWLIANSGDRMGEYSGLIAEHLLLAERIETACQYFTRAGDSALDSYANSEAEGFYRQALDLLPPDQLLAKVISGLGEALFRQGQTEQAKQFWRQAINLYQKLGDSNKLGEIYARLSRLIWHSENFLDAWYLCQEGMKLLEGEPDSPGIARLLAEGGRTALFSNINEQVIPLCNRAIMLAERVGDLEIQAEASITLAINKHDPKECITILRDVTEMVESNGLLRSAYRAHINIGTVLDNSLIDINHSRMHYLRSVEITKQIGDTEGLFFTLQNIAYTYLDLAELDTFQDKLVEHLHSFTVPKSRVEKYLGELQADLLQARGEWESALEAYQAILKDLQKDNKVEQITWKKIGIVDNILEQNRFGYFNDLSDAETALLEIIGKYPKNSFYQFCLVIVYIRQNRLVEAKEQLARANYVLSQEKQGQHTFAPKKTLSDINFELAFTEESWDQAVEISTASIETYQNGGYKWNWARELINLGDAFIKRDRPGDVERARHAYQKSLDMFTEMGAPGYIKVLEERLVNL